MNVNCRLELFIVEIQKKIQKSLRLKNLNRLICAHLNINSVKNKLDSLLNITNNNVGILTISERKLDSSFPMRYSFSFMNFPNHIDLTEIVTEVESCYIFVKTFSKICRHYNDSGEFFC